MIRLFLKAFLLVTLTATVGHAQTFTGEWVGNIDSPPSASLVKGKSELTRLSLTGEAGEIRFPLANFKQKLTLVRLEGASIRLELDSLKLVMTGTINGDEITGDAEVPGTKAGFHLVRTLKVAPETLAKYLGAYRFPNGNYFVVDRFADTPDTLMVTDVKSGEARAFFPRSETKFTAGPFLWVATPPRQTITFRDGGIQVIDSDQKGRQSGAFATRVPMRQEEVTFKNGDVTLAGTLITPVSKGKHPALVFTHGGGRQLREVYWGLGYLYAARGFVVLSYDKRGTGKSTGNWLASSFQDLADDAVAAAKFLQARTDVAPKQIGFWGQSQGGWIAPLAASRFHEAAFAIALSGGGLSPAYQELLDSEYELTRAGYAANEVNDALRFQRLKNDIIVSQTKWDEYAKLRLTAKDAKWYRHPGIDVRGPEKRDDPFWAYMRKFYFYDPTTALLASKAPLLAIFGGLDTPDGVYANVRSIKLTLAQARRRNYTVKVYPNCRHNLMEVPPDNPTEYARLKRFPPGLFETMVDWTMRQLPRRGRR
jgi:pimeloyl-ACP methyl ester carboxylesterase